VPDMRLVGQINETHLSAIIDPSSIVNDGTSAVFDMWAVDISAGEGFLHRWAAVTDYFRPLAAPRQSDRAQHRRFIDLFTAFSGDIDMSYLAEECANHR